MKNLKKENFVWTIPPVGLIILTIIVMSLESCINRGKPNPTEPVLTLESLSHSVNTAWDVYFLTLFLGVVFSGVNYYLIMKLTKKLRQLGHNV